MELLGSAAGVGEDDIHAFSDQALDDGVGALHFAADLGLGKRCGSGGCFHSGWRGQRETEEKAAGGTEAILEMGGGA
jgi:hypothetical protein